MAKTTAAGGTNGGCKATLIAITDEQGIKGDSVELKKEDNEEEENSTKTRRDELSTPNTIIKQFKDGKMEEAFQKDWPGKRPGK